MKMRIVLGVAAFFASFLWLSSEADWRICLVDGRGRAERDYCTRSRFETFAACERAREAMPYGDEGICTF